MPRRRLISYLVLFALALGWFVSPAAAAERKAFAATPVFVDTDIGVDDAVAIAWLLRQSGVDVVGFSTVYGNTTVDNATRNLLTLLEVAGVKEPVTIGADKPLTLPRTRIGAFVHGPDGLWFAQKPGDISALPTDAPAALAAAARANPGLTIIALGPLTNIAKAVQLYPADMAGVRLVALGGGKRGNTTPVAEFNIYADPHALELVLASKMTVELVTLDAFSTVTVDSSRFVERLDARGGAVGQFLAGPVAAYFQATTQGAGGDAALPDVAAVVYAVRADLGTPTSALVRVITDKSYARGQTIIADTLSGRISMIVDDEEFSALADQLLLPGFDLNMALYMILQRQPDNAQVVLQVADRQMARAIERSLLSSR